MAFDKDFFKKLFSDKTAYPDTVTLRVGDNEVPLGDLRSYNDAVGGELVKELDKQRQSLAADQKKLQQATENVAKLSIDLEQKMAAAGKTHEPTVNVDPLKDYATDPTFGPLISYIRQEQSQTSATLKALDDNLKKIATSVGQMGTTYMGDKAYRDFDAIPKDDPDRPADLSLDALYKYAVETRTYDRNNLPDVRAAYDKLTAPQRHARELKEAEERGAQKVREAQAEAAMLPRPVSGLPPLPEGFKPPVNLNDAFNRAGSDRELWKVIQNANAAA